MDPEKYLIESFDEFVLEAKVRDNLKKWKYVKPTPVQKCSMKLIAEGKDIMACAETGSGKTAAFLLPIISKLQVTGVNSEPTEEDYKGLWVTR